MAKLAPERIIVDLVSHIETPAVDSEVNPLPADPQEERANIGAARIEFGQGRQSPPGSIIRLFFRVVRIERKAAHVEPVEVSRVGPVLHDVVKLKEPPA